VSQNVDYLTNVRGHRWQGSGKVNLTLPCLLRPARARQRVMIEFEGQSQAE
jgi:hypothetical protein